MLTPTVYVEIKLQKLKAGLMYKIYRYMNGRPLEVTASHTFLGIGINN